MLENLPKHILRQPKIRAKTLRVYRVGPRQFQVPGRDKIYDLFIVDGEVHCTCFASEYGVKCAHKWAVEDFLIEEAKKGIQK